MSSLTHKSAGQRPDAQTDKDGEKPAKHNPPVVVTPGSVTLSISAPNSTPRIVARPASAQLAITALKPVVKAIHWLLDGLPKTFQGIRGRGRKAISTREARERLMKLADLAEAADEPIEPYTLSKYTTRSPRTISYWLERAEWGIEDLRIQWRRYQKRQSARKSN